MYFILFMSDSFIMALLFFKKEIKEKYKSVLLIFKITKVLFEYCGFFVKTEYFTLFEIQINEIL